MEVLELCGRVIKAGIAEGEAIVTLEPISFYGGVDPDSGIIIEKGHELSGICISGKVLIFPYGKGSTVGSYIIYRLKKKGKAPLAMINRVCEPIVAVGAIISEIPTVDQIDISLLKSGDWVKIVNERVIVKRLKL